MLVASSEIVLDTVDWNEHSIFLSPATQEEVKFLIASLKPKKAAGIDGIQAIVVKNCPEIITPILTEIINNCIACGQFPDALKVARVVPIHKSESKAEIENYRPVSVLPIINNIFERVINSRLLEFVEKCNLLYDFQYGFRKNCGTNTALSEIFDMLYCDMNERKKCTGLFMDLSKAFDCVNHDILLNKLERMGIRGVALQLFKSYLTNRKIIVNANDSLSTPRNINISVPHPCRRSYICFT